MAGDWIKMRGSLCTNPKVLLIAEIIGEDLTVGRKLTTGYNGALCGVVTSDVTRDITVCALLRVWCATNEHTSDGVWENTTLNYLDQVAGIPGFGEAMELSGWADYDEETNSVTLPNFLEYNAPSKNGARSSAAKRQAEYRARKKKTPIESDGSDDVTRDVTRDVTVTPREEKRREDIKPSAKFVLPDWIPADAWAGFEEARRKMKKPMTDRARKIAVTELEKLTSQGFSAQEIIDRSVLNNWQSFYAPKINAPERNGATTALHGRTMQIMTGPA